MNAAGSVEMVSLDVGYTLGAPAGPTITARLVALSPLPAATAKRLAQQHLHTARPGDQAAIARVCSALRIDLDLFPHEHQAPEFTWWPGAVACVAALARVLPVVTVSNVSSWDERPGDVAGHLAPHLAAHYPSWRLGFSKPDPRALRAVAERHGVRVERLVHVGDSFDYDVRGALAADARAVWITSDPTALSELPAVQRPKVMVVPDLHAAVARLTSLSATAVPPHTRSTA
ncbi:HAD family hydrolase [Streptomyces sp. XH2]|uniref:HAD family hydrolase n=1 Tax=Streptomyces sp. XH2 TaxID=3412483 RepID=UPI003C7A12B8